MIVATHQPYFFPYIGYYSLISAVDTFAFLDVAQYTRRSWMSRNRILKPGRDDAQYIHIALCKPKFRMQLPECRINIDSVWKNRVVKQLAHYKKVAPFYEETISVIRDLFEFDDYFLSDFNVRSTQKILQLLDIETQVILYSQIETEKANAENPWDWAVILCKSLKADTYLNAPGGESIYPVNIFSEANIKIGFIQHKLIPYDQKNRQFIPSLSILDVLMFNGIEGAKKLVKEYHVKWVQ